jgi:RNA polymerase sigma-70 factor (ECF subfamily)
MEPTDDDLVEAAALGDRDAFAELYRRRRADVFRFACHMTGNRAAAEDVVQDVFLMVIRDAGRYRRGRSGVVPWLLGIARNFVRRRRAERVHDELPADAAALSAVAADAGMIRDEQLARLRAALLALPGIYREAIVLCDLQELSYDEAAAVIGCALGTVRSRLHRGRAVLARGLRGDAPVMTRWGRPKAIL